MGKRNGKRKRKRNFQLAGPGGISAHPGASARARRACGPAGPAVRGDDGGRHRGAGPHAREREGLTALTATEGGGFDRGPSGGGSPPWVRFFGGEAVAKHGRVKGVTGVGELDRRWPMAAGPRRGGECPRRRGRRCGNWVQSGAGRCAS
jgi:hypothetical protein